MLIIAWGCRKLGHSDMVADTSCVIEQIIFVMLIYSLIRTIVVYTIFSDITVTLKPFSL